MRSYPNLRVVRRRTSGRNDSSTAGSNSGEARKASSSSYSSPICAPCARTPIRPTTSSALMGTRSVTSRGGGRKAAGACSPVSSSGTRPGLVWPVAVCPGSRRVIVSATSGSNSASDRRRPTAAESRRPDRSASLASSMARACTCACGKDSAIANRGSMPPGLRTSRSPRRIVKAASALAFDPMSAPSQLRANSSRSRRPALARADRCPTARVTVAPTGDDMRAHRVDCRASASSMVMASRRRVREYHPARAEGRSAASISRRASSRRSRSMSPSLTLASNVRDQPGVCSEPIEAERSEEDSDTPRLPSWRSIPHASSSRSSRSARMRGSCSPGSRPMSAVRYR